jgi:hypothetical protein
MGLGEEEEGGGNRAEEGGSGGGAGAVGGRGGAIAEHVLSVHCGHDYSAVVTVGGRLWTCGDNSSGKLGHARTEFDCGPSVTGYHAYTRLRLVTPLATSV